MPGLSQLVVFTVIKARGLLSDPPPPFIQDAGTGNGGRGRREGVCRHHLKSKLKPRVFWLNFRKNFLTTGAVLQWKRLPLEVGGISAFGGFQAGARRPPDSNVADPVNLGRSQQGQKG